MLIRFLVLALLAPSFAVAQSYTSYFIGDTADSQVSANGGVCLMGGASESDPAMVWFLQQSGGGDILVLRASGTDGYNDYLYTDLGVNVNSVETILFNSAAASNDAYVQRRVSEAEAIWFAGGDQWDYVSYWRNTPISALINDGLANRNLVIGGTSAGMAIQGGYYFSAENGTVSSANALANPYNTDVTVDSTAFLNNQWLGEVVTDTHYDNPDRKGRQMVFLARMHTDYGVMAKGIACDEYTAVCITPTGLASVYGEHPTYDDNAYFLQVNCDLPDPSPEACTNGTPLDWNRNNAAVKVYAVKGTTTGSNTFDLTDWQTGNGGTWEHWWVDQGSFQSGPGSAPACATGLSESERSSPLQVFPNPAQHQLQIGNLLPTDETVRLYNAQGQLVLAKAIGNTQVSLNVQALPAGIYHLTVNGDKSQRQQKVMIR